MTGPLPQLSPLRLLTGIVAPLAAYLVIRALTGSAVEALAITDAVPGAWLLVRGATRRRVDPIAVLSILTVAVALAAYALSCGDPLALKLRRGAVTGTVGIATLASVAFGRPLLLLVVEHVAKLDPDRRADITAKLAQPDRRRALTILTAIIGATLAMDGACQIALAVTVPTSTFIPDSTAARLAVLTGGAAVAAWYFHYQKAQREKGRR